MINNNQLRELRTKFYYVSHSFGSPEGLIDLISSVSNDAYEVELKVGLILNHPGRVRVVTPWDMRFSMKDLDFTGISKSLAIVPYEPYTVYDLNHRIIYKVIEHQGIWGDSVLDRSLIIQSFSTEMFYLQYSTYHSFNTDLLIVNNLALRGKNALSDNDALKAPPKFDSETGDNHLVPAIEPSNNYIQLTINLPYSIEPYIYIYQLKSTPLVNVSIEDIINNPSTTNQAFTIEGSNVPIIFNPNHSGWLLFVYRSKGENFPLRISNVQGYGVDRFVQSSDYIWYVAVGDEFDVAKLRQSMGLITRRPSDFSTADVIQITAEVSY